MEYVYKAKLRLFSRIGLETLQERSKAIISPFFSCVEADGVTKEKGFLVFLGGGIYHFNSACL